MEKGSEKERDTENSDTPKMFGIKAEYLREMRQNYLMVEAEESQTQGHEAKMLISNTIEGLLKFRIKKMDNRCRFCYEITSKQPLGRLLDTSVIGEAEVRNLLLGIIQILTRLEDYLLAEEQLLLNPDYIYADPETYEPFLCLIPGKKGNFPKEFNLFLQFLLEKVDHQDKEAVVLVYGMYRESLKENYGLDNLVKWLVKEDCPCPIVDSSSVSQRCEKIGPEKIESWEEERAETQGRGPEQHHVAKEDNTLEIRRWYLYFLPAAVMFALTAASGFFLGKYGLDKYGIWLAAAGAVMLILGGILCICQFCTKRKGQLFQKQLYYNFHEQSSHNQQSTEDREHYIQQSYNQTSYSKTSSNNQDNIHTISHTCSQHKPDFDESSKNSGHPDQWQMIFEEPEESESEEVLNYQNPKPEEMHTVLLWNQEDKKEIRSLVSTDGGDDILLSYFPFIIGKQEGLCDHVIPKNTVSRLHIRVDETENGYMVTDLNSTNGTYVNNQCLEANETVLVQPGDEVKIADLKFRLQ